MAITAAFTLSDPGDGDAQAGAASAGQSTVDDDGGAPVPPAAPTPAPTDLPTADPADPGGPAGRAGPAVVDPGGRAAARAPLPVPSAPLTPSDLPTATPPTVEPPVEPEPEPAPPAPPAPTQEPSAPSREDDQGAEEAPTTPPADPGGDDTDDGETAPVEPPPFADSEIELPETFVAGQPQSVRVVPTGTDIEDLDIALTGPAENGAAAASNRATARTAAADGPTAPASTLPLPDDAVDPRLECLLGATLRDCKVALIPVGTAGTIRLTDLAPGVYEMSLTAANRLPTTRTITVIPAPIPSFGADEIVVPAEGRAGDALELSVTAQDSQLDDLVVTIAGPGQEVTTEIRPAEDGRCEFPSLPGACGAAAVPLGEGVTLTLPANLVTTAGTYTVTSTAANRLPETRTIEVVPGFRDVALIDGVLTFGLSGTDATTVTFRAECISGASSDVEVNPAGYCDALGESLLVTNGGVRDLVAGSDGRFRIATDRAPVPADRNTIHRFRLEITSDFWSGSAKRDTGITYTPSG
ncbi:hypothetical protein [Litorihabitans aurantiacus]|uniref:hypothetical protein n=1 Tax=Litorihabitans aurantiacus TaxID=1930061 RepID=UPI0024E0906B|nr:hypothetical protein [Litorihabitans aurantiacus]